MNFLFATSGQALKKYFDFAASYEMNNLHRHGVDGVRVILYGTTLDSPGRRELLNMQSVTAFYPCPHCLYTPQSGVRGLVFGGFRRHLPMNSPWRQREFVYKGQKYMFRDVERRAPPILRNDRNVAVMVSLATRRKPFCGHKGASVMSSWIGADWGGSACDGMHDKKCFTERLVGTLVGKGSHGKYKNWKKDPQHREDCRMYEIFPQVHDDAARSTGYEC